MRDKLIEVINKFDELDFCIPPDWWIEHLADHLLANGVIVFPVKVGDIVYAKQEWYEIGVKRVEYIAEYQVTNFFVSQNKKGEWTKKYCAMKFVDGKTIYWRLNFSFDEIGKTVFLTREEAENALAERRNRDVK
jgi:hypothetical protein